MKLKKLFVINFLNKIIKLYNRKAITNIIISLLQKIKKELWK